MTPARLIAILFIFAATTLAWFLLAASLLTRSDASRRTLAGRVESTWGGRHVQAAPRVSYVVPRRVTEEVEAQGADGERRPRRRSRWVDERVGLDIASHRIVAELHLEHRKKGLLWYDTYEVAFAGRYRVEVPTAVDEVRVGFDFPSTTAIYDGFELRVDGRPLAITSDFGAGVETRIADAGGRELLVEVAYRSRGLDTWTYRLAGDGVAQVRDFELALVTDFDGHDFPVDTLSPTDSVRQDAGWRLLWRAASLVSGKGIGIDLPNRTDPGPLAARITFFAPVALLFFLTVFVIFGWTRGLVLHPMHFFFVAAAFFAFHLLLAYLVDHLDIHLSFAVAAATSVGLVVSYLRLVCGLHRALVWAGSTQIVFLVLFSYAFFFQGYAGLTVTVGGVVTLFALMQLTGRTDWDAVFTRPLPTADG